MHIGSGNSMHRTLLILILSLSSLLHFSRLDQEGFANLYYAAGVQSMMLNWHNFFFVSFDPGGFISIDKPPLGFWIQTASAKAFGFKGWSLIFPQALAGVISVYIIYKLVTRYHGAPAGLIAGLALSVTPIFVATSRNNTIDGLLLLFLLLASLYFLPAVQTLNLRQLLMAFFWVGVGFNVKSLQAYMILPAFYITYMFGLTGNYKRKALHLLIATLVLLGTSLPWFLYVDGVSPHVRPYAASSETNSALDLVFGHNGLGHFLGFGVGVPGQTRAETASIFFRGNAKSGGITAGEIGEPSLLRLFNRQLAGQIAFLLPLALLAAALTIRRRQWEILQPPRWTILFWSLWLIPQAFFFSTAEGFHRYYLIMMAPAIAALTGIGVDVFVTWARREDWTRYILPGALGMTLSTQGMILARHEDYFVLGMLIVIGTTASLGLYWLIHRSRWRETAFQYTVVLGITSILIGPFSWALTPVLYGTGNAGSSPFAGPELNPAARQLDPAKSYVSPKGKFTQNEITNLAHYLTTRRQDEKFIVAVPNAQIGAPLILQTGQPVMTYGGFLGSEKVLTARHLEQLVVNGIVRYVIIGSYYSHQPEIYEWVRSNGVPVPYREWHPPQKSGGERVSYSRIRTLPRLYDCRQATNQLLVLKAD